MAIVMPRGWYLSLLGVRFREWTNYDIKVQWMSSFVGTSRVCYEIFELKFSKMFSTALLNKFSNFFQKMLQH